MAEPTDTTPPAADPPADTTPPPKDTPKDDEPFDKDRAMATITKLREAEKAGKAAARERDEALARLKAFEDSQKSDAEKQAERLQALEAQQVAWAEERKTMNLKLAVYSHVAELGIADADLALLALDRRQVEFDKEGQPSNVKEALTSLLEQKPILKGTAVKPQAPPRIDSGAGTQADGPAPPLTADELAVAMAAGMTPEEYSAAKEKNTVGAWQTKGAPVKT